MPKMKTNSSAKKRFTLTGSGKVKRRKAYKRHILTKKSHKQKKRLGQPTLVDHANLDKVRKLMLI